MDDKTIEAIGIDLSDRVALSAAEAEAKQREEQERIVAYAEAWDRMVQRAAKGIIPRPLRHARMRRNLERKQRAEAREAAEATTVGERWS